MKNSISVTEEKINVHLNLLEDRLKVFPKLAVLYKPWEAIGDADPDALSMAVLEEGNQKWNECPGLCNTIKSEPMKKED